MRAVSECLRDRAGAVALLFALSLFPVIMLLGSVIDLGFVTQSKTRLNAAADAAALAAVKTAADAFIQGLPNYLELGQTAGTQWFDSQGSSVMSTDLPTATITITQTGSTFASSVTYQAKVSSNFAWIFGYPTIPVGGLSTATITANAYVSVTFLLDNSSSMLVAATQAGVDRLGALTQSTNIKLPGHRNKISVVPADLTGTPCAFACHWDAGGNDYYGLARANNIQLRFDVVQSAVQSAINEMINEVVFPSQFSTAIDIFNNTLTQIFPDSTDLNSAIKAAKTMQSPVVLPAANTNFPAAMTALASSSTAAGNGATPASRRKALIIVTDGLADYGSRTLPKSRGPIDPASCTAMKKLGYTVYVLYTTFVIPTQPSELNWVLLSNTDLLPYITGTATPSLAASLQACASATADYAQASDPAAITAAITQMLKSALGAGGRFTN